MSAHLTRELDRLKKLILELSTLAVESQHRAVASLEQRDPALAAEVIEGDARIDAAEVDVEEECLKVLALYQPVAADLRFIVSVLKINNDLERIGDLAVNLAERAALLAKVSPPDIPLDFSGMARKTEKMLRDSLDALIGFDIALAHQVRAADDEVDEMNRVMYDQVKKAIVSEPQHLQALLHLLSASRHLERIADHATNIAEDVIYLVEGAIVRHRGQEIPSE